MKVEAIAKNVRISPRKARLVLGEIRGMGAVQAESALQFMNKKAADLVLKVLRSAIANAEHNQNIAKKDLKVVEITANEGFTIKRFRPRAFGRASQIRKRTSHIRVVLEQTEEAKKQSEQKKKTVKAAAQKEATAQQSAEKKPVAKKAPAKKAAASTKKETKK